MLVQHSWQVMPHLTRSEAQSTRPALKSIAWLGQGQQIKLGDLHLRDPMIYVADSAAGLRFIVIDEVHSFLDTERGLRSMRIWMPRPEGYLPRPVRRRQRLKWARDRFTRWDLVVRHCSLGQAVVRRGRSKQSSRRGVWRRPMKRSLWSSIWRNKSCRAKSTRRCPCQRWIELR